MKKMLSIIMMIMLMGSISSLAIAQDPEEDCYWYFDEGNPEFECELYCNNTTFENISLPYITYEECEECRLEFLEKQTGENETEKEIEKMNYSFGAEIRLLQLEKAIVKNLLKGEMAVSVLKGLGYNTTDLEAILAEMHLVLEEVQTADPHANNSVEVFIDLKSDAKNLTAQFRTIIRALLDGVKYKEIKEQIRNITSDKLQNYSKRIRNLIKQFNVNQIYRLYGIIGNQTSTFVNDYLNGTVNFTQVKLQLMKIINMKTKEKRNQIFSEMKKEKIQNKNFAYGQAGNASKNFSERHLERLRSRLERANNSGNEKLMEKIQNRIENYENSDGGKGNGSNNGNNGNGKGKGKD
jgi:gas vesicle protein